MWLTDWRSCMSVRMDTAGERFQRINNKTAHNNLSMYDDTALSLHDVWFEFGTWTRRWYYER